MTGPLGDIPEVQPFRPRPRNDFLTADDVTAALRWATVERNRGDTASADQILTSLHRSAVKTWGSGHRQAEPIEAEMRRWHVRPAQDPVDTVADRDISEAMVEKVARSLADKIDQAMAVPNYLREYARDALSAALAGHTLVALPDDAEDQIQDEVIRVGSGAEVPAVMALLKSWRVGGQ